MAKLFGKIDKPNGQPRRCLDTTRVRKNSVLLPKWNLKKVCEKPLNGIGKTPLSLDSWCVRLITNTPDFFKVTDR
jgi:hypothetical protein